MATKQKLLDKRQAAALAAMAEAFDDQALHAPALSEIAAEIRNSRLPSPPSMGEGINP